MSSAPDSLNLIRQHQKIIHKVCHLYINNSIDREDLFQEILLNA
ncbi:sigma factor [Spirosoma fluviale]|uniref:Sigma-70 region 2 n=1 Tax=Spirosoma fluviale TaxID=1597977 RepID=A0A286G801_9BACT|nr:sigma factor [Spirosoma fluviale]SOD91655.1 Sigma-70 region 2 [Spirosoma fluviale]